MTKNRSLYMRYVISGGSVKEIDSVIESRLQRMNETND